VELFEKIDPEVDLVTTLFYKVTPHSFGQILNSVKKLPPKTLAKIIEESYQFRGDHDAVFKEAATGNLTFDICMDIGSFRDLHRHRNCIQILKPLNNDYGYDLPKEVAEVGLAKEYEKVLAEVDKAYKQMEKKYPGVGQYLLAQACRRRFLMRMSPWEVQYISELRSRPQGHISYRQISFQMAQLFAQKYPEWGKHFRVTNPQVVDFFKR